MEYKEKKIFSKNASIATHILHFYEEKKSHLSFTEILKRISVICAKFYIKKFRDNIISYSTFGTVRHLIGFVVHVVWTARTAHTACNRVGVL